MNWGKGGGIGGIAGLGEEDVVGGSVGGEGRVGSGHVAEEGDGIVEGGDGGVGLKEGVVEARLNGGIGGI